MNQFQTKTFYNFELPQSMFEEIRRQISYYSVAIMISDGERSAMIPSSGTLCSIGKHRGIITARHVWSHGASGIENHLEIKTPLRKGALTIKRDYMTPIYPSITGKKFDCEVPDIAFIQIPALSCSTLEASNKIFYPIDKYLNDYGDFLFESLDGQWSTYGCPHTLLDISKDQIQVPSLIYRASIPKKSEDNGWDYLEVSIFSKPNGMPQDVRGMSGGGIWRTLFSAEDFSVYDLIFSGINICQTSFSQKYTIVGHGPKSIYMNMPEQVVKS